MVILLILIPSGILSTALTGLIENIWICLSFRIEPKTFFRFSCLRCWRNTPCFWPHSVEFSATNLNHFFWFSFLKFSFITHSSCTKKNLLQLCHKFVVDSVMNFFHPKDENALNQVHSFYFDLFKVIKVSGKISLPHTPRIRIHQ